MASSVKPRTMAAPLSDGQIARAERISLADIASARGLVLKRCGRELVGPCPFCAGRDRFAISITSNLFNCRGCGAKGRGAISLMMFLDGCGFRDAVETLIGERDFQPVSAPPPLLKRTEPGKSGNSDFARAIWHEGVNPRGTLAETYLLNHRDLALDDDLCGRVLRFHAHCPFGRDEAGTTNYVPALIVAFRPFRDDDESMPPQAIHRIGLKPDGSKIDKMMLGPVGGCAVKLDPDDLVEEGLGICEGVETALAIRGTGWLPIWALGSAGAIAKFEPIPGIECITIFADHDAHGRGLAAARECAQRWVDAGCEVIIHLRSAEGKDFADA